MTAERRSPHQCRRAFRQDRRADTSSSCSHGTVCLCQELGTACEVIGSDTAFPHFCFGDVADVAEVIQADQFLKMTCVDTWPDAGLVVVLDFIFLRPAFQRSRLALAASGV